MLFWRAWSKDALRGTIFMLKSLISLAATACAALVIPMHSAWKIVFNLSIVVDILMFKSFEKTPAPVPCAVLEPSVYILT